MHSGGGDLLGYIVIDRLGDGPAWGGMTIARDAGLTHAVAAARSMTDQCRLFGVDRGSHHCVLSADADLPEPAREQRRRAFLEALKPLVEAGYCRIVYTLADDELEPEIARRGLAASARSATLAALERADLEPTAATVACAAATPVAAAVADACDEVGLHLVDPHGRSHVDVLLVGPGGAALDADEAATVRARVVVALDATAVTAGAALRLRERGIVLVSDRLACGGRLVALDLTARGLDERSAVERAALAAARRARECLAGAVEGEGSRAPVRSGSPSG